MSDAPGDNGDNFRPHRTTVWGSLKLKLKRKPSSPSLDAVNHEQKAEDAVAETKDEGRDARSVLMRPRSVSSYAAVSSNCVVHNNTIKVVPKARKKPQFGMTPVALATQFSTVVPEIIVTCVELLKKDLMKEGMFRIPGRMTQILEMKISFEQGNGFPEEEPATYDVAGLFTQFFRELPEPLLTFGMYFDWINAAKLPAEENLDQFGQLLAQLPRPNYDLLKYLIEFLTQVAKHSGANRMNARNLALVFGASLLNPPKAEQYDLENIKLQCEIIEHFIVHYLFLFEGDETRVSGKSITNRNKHCPTIPAGAPKRPLTPEPKAKKSKFFNLSQLSSRSSSMEGAGLSLNDSHSSGISSPLHSTPPLSARSSEQKREKKALMEDIQSKRKPRKRSKAKKEQKDEESEESEDDGKNAPAVLTKHHSIAG